MQGVNNGPVGYGSLINVSDRFRELAIPYVRLHDPNWPHPREVDIPQIFPDFGADPSEPTSYDFDRTDSYIQTVLDTGAGIVYRLGVSIEHTEKKYYTHPPGDYDRWAAICLGIIKHYNQGWADGFYHGIEYWEIWNEPDNPDSDCMWSGTPEQYFELYRTAATVIKAFDPNLKVGGFAATLINFEFTVKFLTYCEEHELPLDFFSWHNYAVAPGELASNASVARKLLNDHGFNHAESHLNEWNLRWSLPWNELWGPGNEYARRDALERLKQEEGASFAAAALILFQDCSIDVANYYDGQPSALLCGLFDYYGVPQKTFYAFKAFRELLDYPERIESKESSDLDEFHTVAVADRGRRKAAILISKFGGKVDDCVINLRNSPMDNDTIVEVYVLDRDHDLDLIKSYQIKGRKAPVGVQLLEHAVVLVKFRW